MITRVFFVLGGGHKFKKDEAQNTEILRNKYNWKNYVF